MRIFQWCFFAKEHRLNGKIRKGNKKTTFEGLVDGFRMEAVKTILCNLKPDKSLLPDGIHPVLLRVCANDAAELLFIIFNESFITGEVPKDWRVAFLSIFKKGKKSKVGNYRPVSLTSVARKVMELLIKDQLTTFLQVSSFLTKVQHGFFKGKSCLTNLLKTFKFWTRALDEGYGIETIYLDYRKVFDKVSHSKLSCKNMEMEDGCYIGYRRS